MNDTTISEHANGVLRALMAMRRESVESLAPAVGMDASTLYRRMQRNKPSAWKAGELYRLAEHFGVSVADLYEGRVTAFVPASSGQGGPSGSLRWDFTPTPGASLMAA